MFENQKESFPEREKRLLDGWIKNDTFRKTLKNRENFPLFSFYDGPPFATGLPHYGHILTGLIKDVVLRYKTMQGFYVPRRFGWDCHGVPVENEIEQMEEFAKNPPIDNPTIGRFNEACRTIVLRYTQEWERTVNRMGRWIDFKNSYKTMDPSFMETVWWVFGALWEKGLVYEGLKVMPFSTKLRTPLSNFEANLNYREVDDPSVIVTFPLIDEPGTSLIVWTTTPWTLPSNLALVVNASILYVKIKEKKSGKKYITSKKSLTRYFKHPGDYELLETLKGERLKGLCYKPIFDHFVDRKTPKMFTILEDQFVEEEDGTGIVHTAPAFGEADFFVCKREGIPPICPVDEQGRFTREVPDYAGQFVKDADKGIIRSLKAQNRLFYQGQVHHRYPFCWRSDTPLIYKAVETWFVSVEKIKEQIIETAKKIEWVPKHIKEGRFGKWLENARDWAISRNRYWGTPIPIWRNDAGDCIVIKSVEELEKRTGKRVQDLHRHRIDTLTFKEKGKLYTRIPEIFDCWFESGSMPYAQSHYPFESEEETMKGFPADFISEGLDQTRCWFYTLTILSTALFDKPAFKNVIVNGIVLAENGSKMSKRLRNYPDPEMMFEKYGADATRLYLLSSQAVQAEDLRFSEKGVELVLRQFLIPLWNAYVFLSTYALIYKWRPERKESTTPFKPKSDIDRWILSLLNRLVKQVRWGMDRYLLSQSVAPFIEFIDQLTNWYIRRCRNRFWSDKESIDRREAFQTLYEVLINLSKVAAPFIPFISEAIYRNLRESQAPESVHLTDFTPYQEGMRDRRLEKKMQAVQTVVSMGHALRKERKIKVRQPLGKAHLVSADHTTLALLKEQQQLIKEELNVKSLEFHSDESSFVSLSITPNFRLLGKRLGPLMKQMKGALERLKEEQMQALLEGKGITLTIENKTVSIESGEIEIKRQVKEGLIASTKNRITIALDPTLNRELIEEGLMREIINKLNTQRREQKFEVTDRIQVTINSTQKVRECLEKFYTIITHEVLATSVSFEETEGIDWDLNGEKATIKIEKLAK